LEEFLRLEKSAPDDLRELQRERIDRAVLAVCCSVCPLLSGTLRNDDRLRLARISRP